MNFYDFEAIRMPAVGDYDTTTEGKWKFKFEWQLENQVLGELIWEQSFPPGRGSLFECLDPLTPTKLNRIPESFLFELFSRGNFKVII